MNARCRRWNTHNPPPAPFSRPCRRAGGLLFACAILFSFQPGCGRAQPSPEISVDASPIQRQSGLNSFAEVVSNVVPSVVSVNTRRTVESRAMGPLLRDPLFRRFFGWDGENLPRPEPRQQRGLGSGVLISKDGYILSNNHVVEGASEILVETIDGRRFDARVIGTDPPTDIAVLKVDGENLPHATLTDSSLVRVGDVVLAIGNPFGVGQTVTAGIVSGIERTGFGITEYEDFIQTDASINPGNSGGALIDAAGRVVGISTAILSGTGGSQGIGFAVPVNLARSVMEQIIRHGKVVRGYIGVYIQPLTPELARAFEVSDGQGALVGGVTPGSPGAEAGLREGDVIVEFAGEPVVNPRDLRFRASQTAPGTETKIAVLRDGERRTLDITLDELPQSERRPGRFPGQEAPETNRMLDGVTLQNLTPELRQRLGAPEGLKGVVVQAVEPGSPAAEAGLAPGDVIVEIGRRPVSNANEMLQALRRAGDSILLRIWSGGGMRYLAIPRE